MSVAFAISLSTSEARTWAEAMVVCLRKLPEGDPRRDAMRGRVDRAVRGKTLFCVDYRNGASVMAPTEFARGLLIEARSWA